MRLTAALGDGILLGQLHAFVEIARQENVTRAAEALFLTQPALTSRIRRLEQQLGAVLLIRDRRGARLTDAGRSFLPFAERTVATMVEGQRVVNDTLSGATGDLVIAAASTIAGYVLPPVIREFSLANPNVRTSLRTALSEDVLDMVVRGTVQIGLARALPHPDVESQPLYEEEWVFVVHQRHRLADEARITAADLAGERFITAVLRSPSYVEFMQMLLRRADLPASSMIDVDNAETGKKVVSELLGVGLFPRTALAEELARGELRRLVVDGLPPMKRTMAAMRLRRSPELSSVRDLLHALRAQLTKMGYEVHDAKPAARRTRAAGTKAKRRASA